MNDLIFDRTIDDINNDTDKAYLQKADYDRVQEWISYLSTEFGLNLTVTPLEFAAAITEPIITEILNNLTAIRNNHAWSFTPITPSKDNLTPSKDNWNWVKQNAVEKILYDVNLWWNNQQARWIYCGTLRCGQRKI